MTLEEFDRDLTDLMIRAANCVPPEEIFCKVHEVGLVAIAKLLGIKRTCEIVDQHVAGLRGVLARRLAIENFNQGVTEGEA